jgi:hydrogenase small subunit
MPADQRPDRTLSGAGVSRRAFLKYCATVASLLALPDGAAARLAEKLASAHRLPVIWLSIQSCGGCAQSLMRARAPTLEQLLFDFISLDYQPMLMAASGTDAEENRRQTLQTWHGRYLLVVEGSIPASPGYASSAGTDSLERLRQCLDGAVAVLSVGTCAAFGGLPAAQPNPTGAEGIDELMKRALLPWRPLVNIPGCPPVPAVITAVLAHYLAFGHFPQIDSLARPLAFYGNSVHERCSRFHYYRNRMFAQRFDDEGARNGWCLYQLGCKGPSTRNACATLKWNNGTGSPIDAGHPCLGCAEPEFWDQGGFYRNPPLPEQDVPDVTAAHGEMLYKDQCASCHGADPGALRNPPDQLVEAMHSGWRDVLHQHLDLDAEQLEQLKAYLNATRNATPK